MIEELTRKQAQNRTRELETEKMVEWDNLCNAIHDKRTVILKTILNGKVVNKYLGYEKKVQYEK